MDFKFYRYVFNDNGHDTLDYLKEGVALITATAFISTVLILTLLVSIDYLVAGAGERACTYECSFINPKLD